MVTNLYCMRDDFIGFMLPSPVANDNAAVRSFKDAVEAGKVQHPEHISLWLLGSFDDQTGVLVSDVRCVCKASDFFADVPADTGINIESGEVDNEVL